MESSITFPTAFDPKFEKSAELIAYLTNGIAYRDNGDIRVAGKSELNKIIAEKYEQKDFIGASKILEDVKKTFETTSEELAERVSRSIRVPAPTYLKLIKIAFRNGVSLATVMRNEVIGPAIKSALYELSSRPEVAPDRLSRVEAVFEDWIEPESAKHGGYSLDFTYEHSLKVCEMLTRYVEFEFFRHCAKLDVPKEAAELYWSYVVSPSDTLYDSWIMNTRSMDIYKSYNEITFIDEHYMTTVLINDDLSLNYLLHLSASPYANHRMFDAAMDDIREQFGQWIVNSIVTAIMNYNWEYNTKNSKYTNKYTEEEYITEHDGNVPSIVDMHTEFDITLKVDGDRVYLGGIEVCEENRNAIAKSVLTEHLHGTTLDEQRTQEEIQNAINADDLDKASDLSKKLAEYSVRMGVSEWITNSLFSAVETSEVITFTIPPIFIPILIHSIY